MNYQTENIFHEIWTAWRGPLNARATGAAEAPPPSRPNLSAATHYFSLYDRGPYMGRDGR